MEQPPKTFLKDQSEYLNRLLSDLFIKTQDIRAYDINLASDVPPSTPSAYIAIFAVPRRLVISQKVPSFARTTTPYTGDAHFYVMRNNDIIGNVDFISGQTTGKVTFATSTTVILPNDVLALSTSAIVNLTMTNVALTLVCTR